MTLTRSNGTTYQDDSITLNRAEVKSYPIDSLPDLTEVSYPPVGRCIYCGSTAGLTREHVIPYGLNGELVLPSASCTKCAAVTSKCELQVLRKLLQTVRMLRRMRSRRKHAGATRYIEFKFVKDGQPRTGRIAIEEFPFLLHLPKFATP